MITSTNIDTSAVVESNGDPVITLQIDGSDLLAIYKSVAIAGVMMSQMHDRICSGDEDDPVNQSLHSALDQMEALLENLTEIVDEADAASPECPGCGEHHFHQPDVGTLPTRMSDEALAEVIDMFAKNDDEEE
jgi:hypothetical protein